MKHLITILAVFSLACLGAGMANAESSPPTGYNIIDFVNIGDAVGANTEGGRNMNEWGPSFDAGIWFSPEYSDYYRQIWGWTTPPAGYPAGEDSENWAEIDMDFTKPANTGQLNIGFFYLAGAGDDNFNVYIDGTLIGTVTEIQTSNTMVRKYLAVPSGVTAGTHTVKLECSEDAWTSQATYGQVTIDEIYTFTDPLIDPIIEPIAIDSNPINCSGTKAVNFHYTPGTNPDIRGYTVRVACDAPLSFIANDVTFSTLPSGVTFQSFVTEVTAGSVYDVDYAILGGSVGISAEADLFSVDFHGAATGTGVVSMTSVRFSALDGTPITPITSDGTADIAVDCTAPDTPVMDVEPAYTQGLSNTVSWSDESGSGATLYYAEYATDAGFTALVGNSGWINALNYEFTGLTDDQIYYYRVKAKDALDNESAWSNVESSTQDATAPATKVTALGQFQVDSFFDVLYELDSGDDGSDFTKVELFYKGPGVTTWTLYDVFVDLATPLVFETGPTGTNTGDGTYYFYSKGTDHVGNEEQPPSSFPPGSDYDATTTVDTSDLVVNYFRINNDDTYTTSTGVTLSMDVPDAVDMEFSNDGTTWSGYVTYATTYPWTLTTGEGTKTVYAHFRELPSYRVTDAQDDIILDTTPPGGVTDLTASRGMEKITLTWTNPGGEQTGVEMWRAVWNTGDDVTSAYPEYDDITGNMIPTVPTDRAAAAADPAWTMVDLSSETYPFASFTDLLTVRGIYYYVVYPVDAAGLYGAGDDASSISYLLGDVATPYGGDVTGADITVLGAAYGTIEVIPNPTPYYYNNECDVGPTDDYSGAGIPTTDNVINFDDLMIFALNWDITVAKARPTEGGLIARFAWVKIDDTTWSLMLTEPCANLKGVNLQATLAQGSLLSVTPGSLLGQQDSPHFLQNIPTKGLDAGLALLGNGACITGQGELIRLNMAGEFKPDNVSIVARDAANKNLEYTLEESTVGADIPTKYELSANYPNPFNPSTKIEFALPELQHVRLSIFSVDGRRVATLKDESMSAGHYSVTWTGTNEQGGTVAAGIYFYRLEAGNFSRTQKMTLVK